jgi:hypothetical protein
MKVYEPIDNKFYPSKAVSYVNKKMSNSKSDSLNLESNKYIHKIYGPDFHVLEEKNLKFLKLNVPYYVTFAFLNEIVDVKLDIMEKVKFMIDEQHNLYIHVLGKSKNSKGYKFYPHIYEGKVVTSNASRPMILHAKLKDAKESCNNIPKIADSNKKYKSSSKKKLFGWF